MLTDAVNPELGMPRSEPRRSPTALLVVGTRPEAIKLAPLFTALRDRREVQPVVVTTGQHQAVVDDVLELFGIVPQRSLRLPRRAAGGLARLYADLLGQLDRVMALLDPDVVVVQGDTASVLAGAQTAFLQRRPVVHVEAGLRSWSLSAPFPEEANRRLVSTIASLHLAPTPTAEANLLLEGHNPDTVLVTGNTAVDALLFAVAAPVPLPDPRLEAACAGGRRLVVVTAHRRESWGDGMRRIASAVTTLADAHPEVLFAAVTHMNPSVRQIFETAFSTRSNVFVTGPLRYVQFVRLLAGAEVVLTDSGGIQEEAPVLGVPVLVLRDRTERTEGLDAGAAELVGTDAGAIVAAAHRVLTGPRERSRVVACSLYGDGRAAERSADAIGWLLGMCPRPEAFDVRPLISPSASVSTH
ncbi:MAG: UDP-N-acetylglucosamine 2-epimerase (non-hydrolyzing) [Actinobacteria bacterium]|nr:UDP-N-acetylglucosamine 2-epimerase (non-hydrolyzing) [Actinomycetota bacterium]